VHPVLARADFFYTPVPAAALCCRVLSVTVPPTSRCFLKQQCPSTPTILTKKRCSKYFSTCLPEHDTSLRGSGAPLFSTGQIGYQWLATRPRLSRSGEPRP